MASKKPAVIAIEDPSQLEQYLNPELNKIVVMNAFDTVWGPVTVIDGLIKTYTDEPEMQNKVVFITCDKNICSDLFGKYVFTSKPTYYILHRGTVVDQVIGLIYPEIISKVEKAYSLL